VSEAILAVRHAYEHFDFLALSGTDGARRASEGLIKAMHILKNAEKLSEILSGCQEL
jgi:hypothetical protein